MATGTEQRDALRMGFDAVNHNIAELRADMDTRFDQVDAQLEEIKSLIMVATQERL